MKCTRPGVYRGRGVGVFAGDAVIHMAPPADQVPRLMGDLFSWLCTTDTHPLISSSVFHCEFEFIHPFLDGNGRLGRLWQTLLLSRWNPVFAWLPVENLVHQHQDRYYEAIRASSKQADCAPFLRFMLVCIETAVAKALAGEPQETLQKTPCKTPLKTPSLILALLRERSEMSLAEIAAELGKSESAIKRAVRKLREAGRLKRIGPDKGGRWEVVENDAD